MHRPLNPSARPRRSPTTAALGIRYVLMLALLLSCVAAPAVQALDTLYLIRHGEKEVPWPKTLGTYQPLDDAGRQRAAMWADELADIDLKEPIAAVYSSPYSRTVQTALPVARALGLTVQVDPASAEKGSIAAFVETLKTQHASDGAVVVVGHSDTIPYFLRHFGADPTCANALTLHTSGAYELIAGYAGLFRVDLNGQGCTAIERREVEPQEAEPEAETADLEARPIWLDAAHLEPAQRRYRVTYGRESMGLSDLELAAVDDGLEVRQSVQIARASIQQDIRIGIAVDASPRQHRTDSVRMSGPMGPSSADVLLQTLDGRLQGHSEVPRSRQKPQGKLAVDRTLPAGTFERHALLALLPAMPIDRVAAFSLYAYDSRDDTLHPVDVRVTGPMAPPDHLALGGQGTKASSSEAQGLYRVEVQGTEPNYVVWIHPETPRHVVAIEWVGQSWIYALVPGKP